jgi:hypothetical protein
VGVKTGFTKTCRLKFTNGNKSRLIVSMEKEAATVRVSITYSETIAKVATRSRRDLLTKIPKAFAAGPGND